MKEKKGFKMTRLDDAEKILIYIKDLIEAVIDSECRNTECLVFISDAIESYVKKYIEGGA